MPISGKNSPIGPQFSKFAGIKTSQQTGPQTVTQIPLPYNALKGAWNGVCMDNSETSIQSFVIRFWLEEPGGQVNEALWRGHITHVPSRRRVHLNDLEQIIRFIIPYLQDRGSEPKEEQGQRSDYV